MTNFEKYKMLSNKLKKKTITKEEMLLLNLLAFGSDYVNSNNKGELKEYK